MSRKKAADPVELCVNFCTYYKPGKNEELQCQGFVAVQRLTRGGKALSFRRPRSISAPDAQVIEELKGRVCSACAFREADCDYILTNGTAPPCGGFVFLSHLLKIGDTALEEIGPKGK